MVICNSQYFLFSFFFHRPLSSDARRRGHKSEETCETLLISFEDIYLALHLSSRCTKWFLNYSWLYYTYGSSDEITAQIRPPRIKTDFQISYISPKKNTDSLWVIKLWLGKIIIRIVKKNGQVKRNVLSYIIK